MAQSRMFYSALARLLRHRMREDANKVIPRDMVKRLGERVGASEKRHSGEIRIYVEAGLPTSYIMRHATPRERAVAMFGKLRVWDTEHNNGVLIYLLLAEQAIELVADRGLASRVDPAEWHRIIGRMRKAFREARYEDGLTEALAEVSTLLVANFPLAAGEANRDELPNEPVIG